MAVATTWNGDANLEALKRRAAANLLAAAVFFENAHRQRLGVPNPPPHADSSKPGEYPRLRTGFGQKGLTHYPRTVAEVAKLGYVRVGFVENARYMVILEVARDRLGLLRTLEDLRPQLAALATGRLT